jgi:phage terminase small subunit
MAALNDKQKRFVDEYIKDLNATQAAIRAGYAKKTAHVQGPRLLGNVRIKEQIKIRMDEKEKTLIADQDEILKFLTSVVRGEITEEVPLLAGDGFQELRDKDIAAKDRIKAAELLGKRYAMWTDKKDITADVGVAIIDDTGDDEDDAD